MEPPPKYPRIPHLAPIADMDRDDLMLDDRSRDYLVAHPAVVEEKLDGANISIWIEDSVPLIATRGGPNTSDRGGQRGRARAWAAEHADQLRAALGDRYAVYAEWLLRRHQVRYDRLTAPLVGIDVFDGEKRRFLPLDERDAMLATAGLEVPPVLFTGALGSVDQTNTRAKRHARAKALRESRREGAAAHSFGRRLEEMFGGETPTERSAEVIIEWFGPSAVAAGMSRFFIIRSTPERAREVTQAAAELAPESVCALSLAADVAMHVECNHRRASSLIDRALALTEDDRDRVVLADYLLRLGRASDALAIVEVLHLDDPEDDHLEAIRANGLILAWQRATAEPGDEHIPDECPCWSGRPWAECCQPAERKAIR